MRRVILESPYAGATEENTRYARRCVRDSLLRGEAPLASHLLYTQLGILRDEVPEERELGMAAGWAWFGSAQSCVLYVDHGISSGMLRGKEEAKRHDLVIEHRHLDYWNANEDMRLSIGGAIHLPPGTLYSDGCWIEGDYKESCPSHRSPWRARYHKDGRRDVRIMY